MANPLHDSYRAVRRAPFRRTYFPKSKVSPRAVGREIVDNNDLFFERDVTASTWQTSFNRIALVEYGNMMESFFGVLNLFGVNG